MKAGSTKIYVEVNDISGAPVALDTGWDIVGVVGGEEISTISVTALSGDKLGFHECDVFLPAGVGFVKIFNSDDNYFVTPSFYDINNTSYDEDDIYGRVVIATSATSLPIVPSARYNRIVISAKEGDDISEIIQVPERWRPLTGWTNISVEAYPEARLTSTTTPAITGTYEATVLNETDGTVEVLIGKDVTTAQVPDKVQSTIIYADLHGDDPDGKRRTLSELNITLRRDFNTKNP